jgi:hypothetical protein
MTDFLGAGDIVLFTDAPGPFPVIWTPTGDVIGSASTHAGALRAAWFMAELPQGQRTAQLATDLNGSLAWFCGAQLK